jgi:hypothetical protein
VRTGGAEVYGMSHSKAALRLQGHYSLDWVTIVWQGNVKMPVEILGQLLTMGLEILRKLAAQMRSSAVSHGTGLPKGATPRSRV